MIDSAVPLNLLKMQQWFGSMIAQPFQPGQRIPQTSPFYKNVENEAQRYLMPSPYLLPHQRIEIYHQQYWWRLLKCLQENFPFVTRLFGYTHFNRQIGIPYLSKHPPQHWALCRLGENLTEWILTDYKQDDRDLIARAASIDWAAQHAFSAPKLPSLNFNSPEEALSLNLTLQPHLQLFALNLDLFSFRDTFLQEEVDYWNSHPFPEVEGGECYFVIYRSPDNLVAWDKISQGEHRMLSFFQEGKTINESCERLEKERGEALKQAEEMLPLWFKRWVSLNWLTEKKD